VVVGDFNATTEMYEFRDILGTDLKDAAVEAGDGWQMTWSRMSRLLPPLVRIDHVLYSRGLTVTSYHTAGDPGSDHQLITATLASTSQPAG
jgi:endonuclease/exonuclease/phosphatase family metal-dependent hydrolase